MQRKLSAATNADLNDLIKIVENEEAEEKVILLEDDLFSFLQQFNIKNGEQLVLKSVIYDLYRHWSEFPLKQKTFSVRMLRYLQDHRTKDKKYYKVNRDSFSLNEELLKYLERKKQKKTRYSSWKNHFDKYLQFYNLSVGNKWIPASVLKHLYDKWCYKNNKKSFLSEKQLSAFFKLYFPYKRNGQSRMEWFSVNEEFVKIFVTPGMLIKQTKKGNTKR